MSRISDALVAHYKMNDNAASAVVVDSIGNHSGGYQINGVAQNTDTGNSTGKINGALALVKTDKEHIEIADHADFTPASTPFSISAWVYMHDSALFTIASKGVYNTDGEWVFCTQAFIHKLEMRLYDESVDNCYIGRNSTITLDSYENSWIHLAMAYDGGTLSSGIKIYLNGKRVDTTNDESNAGSFVAVENLTHAVWIGVENVTFADGLIDNVMLFTAVLTPDEVKRLFNNGHGTEIPADLDKPRFPRRSSSPFGLRAKYEN